MTDSPLIYMKKTTETINFILLFCTNESHDKTTSTFTDIVFLVPQDGGSRRVTWQDVMERCESADRKCAIVTLSTSATALALTKCTKHRCCFPNYKYWHGHRKQTTAFKRFQWTKSPNIDRPSRRYKSHNVCDITSGSLPRNMTDIEPHWSDLSIIHLDGHRILHYYMACNY